MPSGWGSISSTYVFIAFLGSAACLMHTPMSTTLTISELPIRWLFHLRREHLLLFNFHRVSYQYMKTTLRQWNLSLLLLSAQLSPEVSNSVASIHSPSFVHNWSQSFSSGPFGEDIRFCLTLSIITQVQL